MRPVTSFMRLITQHPFTTSERAVSFNVGYTMTVAITTILIIGLISGVGGLLHTEQNKAVTHQVTVTSDKIATGVMQTDRLAHTGNTTQTHLTVAQDTPSQTVSTQYFIELRNESTGPHVHVETATGEHSNSVPITTHAEINESRVTAGGTIYITHTINTDTGEPELALRSGSDLS